MIKYKCKMCGGSLAVEDGQKIVCCDYCGTSQTVPIFDSEKKTSYYNRANQLRLRCEFDKAAGVYETLVTESPNEAEAYWGLVLCKYGIEYVDDVSTGKKIPTCHRTKTSSIFDDVDYKKTIECADVVAREIYEKEAAVIDDLQKKILAISLKEEPFDIFICYKEADENGDRTEDSLIATNIYNELSKVGYKVFLSRITLEKQLGNNYEPYIFAALQSSRLMIHVTTSKAYSESVWVKNEWSRYLSLINDNHNKTLITCYKNILPKELPVELRHIQGQDMSKIGAIQDLLYGVEKLFGRAEKVVSGNPLIVDSTVKPTQLDEYTERVKELSELDSFCCYASEIFPLIAFFEDAGDYLDSKKYLREAKLHFIKRAQTYEECLQALFFLSELGDEDDHSELKEALTSKAIQYRTIELQKIGYAVKPIEITSTNDFCYLIDGLVDSIKKTKGDLSEVDAEIVSASQKQAYELIYQSANEIIEQENDELQLRKIATLFQALTSETGLKTNEVDYTSIIAKKIDQLDRAKKAKKRKKMIIIGAAIIIVIALIIIIAVSVAGSNNKKEQGYSADNFSISVVSKTNDSYNETLASGYVGSGYYYTFKFNVKNSGPYPVSRIVGNMDVNNAAGKNLATTTVTMSGDLKANSSSSWDIQLNVYKGDDAREIWNTDFELLQVTFKITSVTFDDGTTKYYSDTRNVIVHEIEKSYLSSKSGSEASLTNKNTDGNSPVDSATKEDGRSLIEKVKDYAGSSAIIPDNYLTGDYYVEDCGCFSNYDNLWHDSFYIFFTVSETYSFRDAFITKLIDEGYELRYNGYYEWEYIKDKTVIYFENVKESWVETSYGQSEFQYYYFNYYVYVI